jgi:hypothetical protein
MLDDDFCGIHRPTLSSATDKAQVCWRATRDGAQVNVGWT